MDIVINNRKYSLGRFFFGYTYDAVLIGTPNKEINESILSEIQPEGKLFHQNIVRISVSEEDLDGVLPACYYFAEIQSDSIKEGFCGSIMTLCWFDEPPGSRSILEIVDKPLRTVDWEAAAEDFDF